MKRTGLESPRSGGLQFWSCCWSHPKERLLDAETDTQIEAAIRRVGILCDD